MAGPAAGLVEELDRLVQSDEALIDLLRPAFDHRRVTILVEYVAARLGLDRGERSVTFKFSDGYLRRTQLEHGPVGNTELEAVARRE